MSSAQRSRLATVGRLLALALLALALRDPAWVVRPPPAPLVLLDDSASMILGGGERPAERLRRWLDGEPELSGIRLIRFGAAPLPVIEMRSHDAERLLPRLDDTATDIELALRHALAAAGPDEPILLLTDGVETTGDAAPLLRRARAAGRSIYLLDGRPSTAATSAWVESIDLPPVVMPGQRFDAVMSLSASVAQPVQVDVYAQRERVASLSFDLNPGRTVRTLTLQADTAGTLPLRFVLRGGAAAGRFEDTWHDVVNVHGKARIAYVADEPAPALWTSLLQGGWPVERVAAGRLSGILPRVSVVVLDDVSGRAASDADWSALVQAVRQRGVGLVVLGGTHSFGAGGYRGSLLESILPVTAEAGVPLEPAAVLFLLDRSGSMGRAAASGTRIGHARRAVLATIANLDPADQAGIVTFHAGAELLMPLDRYRDPGAVAEERLATVRPSGGTHLTQGLLLALRELAASPARQRLLVLVTDGFTGATDLRDVADRVDDLDIDVIAIAVGDSPDLEALRTLTAGNGGLLLTAGDATRLPRLVPAAVGSRRLTVEAGIERVVTAAPLPHLPAGLEWPPVDGFAVTRARPSATVHLRTTRGDPLLVSHRAGLGTVLALPAGLGRFATRWQRWPDWDVLAGGLVEWAAGARWSERSRVQIVSRPDGVHLLVDAVNESRDWLQPGGAEVSARLTVPGSRPQTLALSASAPGRFDAPLPAAAGGRHRLAIDIGDQRVHRDFVPHPASERSLRESQLPAWLREGLLRPWPPQHPPSSPHSLRVPLIVAALVAYAVTMIVNLHPGRNGS